MKYVYDLHAHSQENSACSHFPVQDMVRFYKAHGYTGFILTDHFTGSTTIEREAAWEERVNRFYRTYEIASEEAGRIGGIQVFFGMEFSLRRDPEDYGACLGNDFVIFNLSREWILEHEEAFGMDPRANFDQIRAAGGCVIHAHPFLEADWVRSIQLLPRHVDAVEIYNGGVDADANAAARWYADRYGLPYSAGSDIHGAEQDRLCGVESEVPLKTPAELAAALKAREVTPFMRPAGEMR